MISFNKIKEFFLEQQNKKAEKEFASLKVNDDATIYLLHEK
jgi:hypothetical protein